MTLTSGIPAGGFFGHAVRPGVLPPGSEVDIEQGGPRRGGGGAVLTAPCALTAISRALTAILIVRARALTIDCVRLS